MSEAEPDLRPERVPEMIRFGPFEADIRAGELRKYGIRIKLKQQPFQVLHMLLKQPGRAVLREEIRDKLWPNDTVVEFDQSINAAIQKLRDALGESASAPRYIETLPRRGYRFIGTVESASKPVEPLAPNPVPVTPLPVQTPKPPALSKQVWVSVLVAAVAGLAIFAARFMNPQAVRPTVSNWTFSLGDIGPAEVSPDGSAVAYRSGREISLKRMDSLEQSVVYRENALNDELVWSPDGSQLLFRTIPGLIRLPLAHGQPAVLWAQAPITRGYAWSPDGTLIVAVAARPIGGLYLISPGGGTPTRMEVPGLTGGVLYYPEFLPDGNNILFGWSEYIPEVGLYLATLKGSKITRGPFLLRKGLTTGHYARSHGDKLLYIQNDKLYAQSLNVGQGRLEGEPENVVDGVASNVMMHHPSFSVSRNGVMVWQSGRAGLANLTWFDRGGMVLGVAGPPCLPFAVRLSPNEKHVAAFTVADGGGFGIIESNQSGYVRLFGDPAARSPAIPGTDIPAPDIDDVIWMPDGGHILYAREDKHAPAGETVRLIEREVEGGTDQELARVPNLGVIHDVSPDGKVLLYKVGLTLYSVRLDRPSGEAKPQIVAQSTQARFSPDGRWIVYAQVPNDRREVYVQPFPSGGLPTQITSSGGEDAVWRGDGREILYRNGSTIYSVPVEVQGNTIRANRPEALFNIHVPDGLTADSMPMAVTRDGSKILFAQGVEQPNPQLTYVMTAWDRRRRR